MIRAAIIGMGWWGQTIARNLATSDVIKPVLGIDPLEPMRAKGAALGLETSAHFEDVLARSDIDAVILCTPQEHHAGQIEAAARAGRHVFCEKPLCTTATDAKRAITAVKNAKVQLGIGHERRFEPAVIEMRKRLTDGEFGNALVLEGNFSQDKFLNLPRDNWRLSNTVNPVGPLSATGIHLVDLSIAMLGKPTRVWARLATLGSQFANGDTLSISIGFESGASATLNAVLATPFMGRLALLGSKGWMEIRDRTHPENPTGWDVTRVLREQPTEAAYYQPHPAVRDNLEAFGRAALGGPAYPVPYDEMLTNVRTFEAIQRSAKSGCIEPV
ncbi:MAG: Gfo/Idh/MocA family oxidoreductase [Afipia sp.]|nr:Gfo/Idh/MocA family oxidoreductase [Afipia sp.]